MEYFKFSKERQFIQNIWNIKNRTRTYSTYTIDWTYVSFCDRKSKFSYSSWWNKVAWALRVNYCCRVCKASFKKTHSINHDYLSYLQHMKRFVEGGFQNSCPMKSLEVYRDILVPTHEEAVATCVAVSTTSIFFNPEYKQRNYLGRHLKF